MFDTVTGEWLIKEGLTIIGEVRKVIQKPDFTDEETKERKPGGFEVEVLCEMGENTRDVMYNVKCTNPDDFKPLVRKRIMLTVKINAWQFGNKDPQISFTAPEGTKPIPIDSIIKSYGNALNKAAETNHQSQTTNNETPPPAMTNKPANSGGIMNSIMGGGK